MVRNRHKKPNSSAAPAADETAILSPAAQEILSQMAEDDPETRQKRTVEALMDSGRLADELEFEDFYLNPEKAREASQRLFKKNEKRLQFAKKHGEEKYQMAYDDVRIEIIKELFHASLRQDVLTRLRALLERAMGENDRETLEMVLYLTPVLTSNQIPWGVCMLVLNLYAKALKSSSGGLDLKLQEFFSIMDGLVDKSGSKLDVDSLQDDPEMLAKLKAEILEKNPEILEKAEDFLWEQVKDFEEKLFDGEIELDLFTQDELDIPFERWPEETGVPLEELFRSDDQGKRVFELFQKTVAEIMTPGRVRKMRKDLQRIVRTWKKQDTPWLLALQYELEILEEDPEEDSLFFLSAYIGQFKHLAD